MHKFNKGTYSSSIYGSTAEENVRYITNENFIETNHSNFLSLAIPNFSRMFSNISDYISNAFSSSNCKELESYTKDQQRIINGLKNRNFAELSDVLVPVPENFKGNYIAYLKDLEPIVKNSMVSCLNNINEFRNYISLFMSTSDYKTNVKDFTKKYKDLEFYRNSCVKTLNKYFPRDTSSSRTMLKNVVDRVADFNEIFTITNRLNGIIKSVNVGKIQEAVNDCYNVLNMISNNLDKDTSSISKEAAKNLSVGSYEVAKYVEFVASLYFDTVTAVKSAINMGDILLID